VVVTDIEEIGDGFIEHPVPDVIVFTGSSATGMHVAEVAGRRLKKVVLELGGNSAFIVLDDADLDLAVNAAVFSRFTHAGQVCLSANRIIVDRSLHDEFVARYVARAAALTVGDPRDAATVIGPLISPGQASVLEGHVANGVRHGAKLALAPRHRDHDSSLCSPAVLIEVTVDNPVSQVELFGPAVCIMKAEDDADAVGIANATPYGLSGAVHTTDLERGVRIAHQLRTGMVHVNNATIADEVAVPFGGVGASGNGRLNGDATLQAFTRPIWLSVHHGTPRFPY
jgi:aldehyde dehydrogenase (NAD+)